MPDKCTHADYLTTNMYCLECGHDVSHYYVGRHLYDAQVERVAELEEGLRAMVGVFHPREYPGPDLYVETMAYQKALALLPKEAHDAPAH